ncbi:MAG: SGNH/GDSL hydrolase family protein [Microcoleaceae cyanobacterium]
MKAALVIGILLIGLAIALEIGLRLLFGFGSPLLYLADPEIGYLLAPSQKTRRFGNRIAINEYSMRSGSISPSPQASTLRVLLLGDSIVNGAWWTDQSETLSALLEQQLTLSFDLQQHLKQHLQQHLKPGLKPSLERLNLQDPLHFIEVLNASANSWGPPNQLAYLQHFGTFQAQVIVLLINTDDLFAGRPNPGIVGRDRNYPDHKPALAVIEVFKRYFAKSQPVPPPAEPQPQDLVGLNLDAIQQIRAIATQNRAEFILAMTPLLRELGEPGPRDYEIKARHRLKDLTQVEQIFYIDFLDPLNATTHPQSLYRDHIHLSPAGNQWVSQALAQALQRIP